MSKKKKLTLAEVKSILEYNKTMLTSDMSISRDPEHQDVGPDYYGKDAEDLYNAIVFIEKYLDNSIPIEWIEKWLEAQERILRISPPYYHQITVRKMLEDWEKENENR